ncbi:alanine racemase [Candidatus Neomarinimicrobiota bacterium]
MYVPQAKIHLNRLVHNYNSVKKIVGGAGVMAVVKADAYGHGMLPISMALAEAGTTAFGVATLTEALDLKKAGLTPFILHMGRFEPDRLNEYVEHDLRLSIQALEDIDILESAHAANGAEFIAHLKIDTGMTRMGVPYEQGVEALERINALPFIKLEGLYSHFATADEAEQSYLRYQLIRFTQFAHMTRKMGMQVDYFHTANSAAILQDAASHFNMVRPGLLLYGAVPAGHLDLPFEPKPVMDLWAPVVLNRQLAKGTPIGYGREYRAPEKGETAVLQIGYADGFPVSLSNKGLVEINGQIRQILGRISMDLSNIDITGMDVKLGERALVWGMGSETVRIEQQALRAGTIPYELLTGLGKRVVRIYVK